MSETQELSPPDKMTKEEGKSPLGVGQSNESEPTVSRDTAEEIQQKPMTAQEASDLMAQRRAELGLAQNREKDPRWQAAYNAAYVEPPPIRDYERAFEESFNAARRVYTATRQQNIEVARGAADAALKLQDPKAYLAYERYGEYATASRDPDFDRLFPLAGATRHDRLRDVHAIDDWIQKNPEKATRYEQMIRRMRRDAVEGTFASGGELPRSDLEMMLARRRRPPEESDRQEAKDARALAIIEGGLNRGQAEPKPPEGLHGNERLNNLGIYIDSSSGLYEKVATADDPQETLEFVLEAAEAYIALLEADPDAIQATSASIRKQIADQLEVAQAAEDRSSTDRLQLQLDIIEAILTRPDLGGTATDTQEAATPPPLSPEAAAERMEPFGRMEQELGVATNREAHHEGWDKTPTEVHFSTGLSYITIDIERDSLLADFLKKIRQGIKEGPNPVLLAEEITRSVVNLTPNVDADGSYHEGRYASLGEALQQPVECVERALAMEASLKMFGFSDAQMLLSTNRGPQGVEGHTDVELSINGNPYVVVTMGEFAGGVMPREIYMNTYLPLREQQGLGKREIRKNGNPPSFQAI